MSIKKFDSFNTNEGMINEFMIQDNLNRVDFKKLTNIFISLSKFRSEPFEQEVFDKLVSDGIKEMNNIKVDMSDIKEHLIKITSLI